MAGPSSRQSLSNKASSPSPSLKPPPPQSPIMRKTKDAPRCHLLALPTELRLNIYDFALADSESVTITSAAVRDEDGESLNPSASFSSISDLPDDHVPLIKTQHDPSVLSITTPPTIRSAASSFAFSLASSRSSLDTTSSTSTADTDLCLPADDEYNPVSASLCLRQTCKFINDELTAHMSHRMTAKSTLHISYPYGLLVLRDRCPHLLHRAKEIHIYGAHNLADTGPASDVVRERRSRLPRRDPLPTFPKVPDTVKAAAAAALKSLVRTVLSDKGHPCLQKLELRIFYPDEDSYSQVWRDELSPIVLAMQNTCNGKIQMVCWRGRQGTGLHLTIEPSPDARRVASLWRKLGDYETEGGKEDCEKWVLGGAAPGGSEA